MCSPRPTGHIHWGCLAKKALQDSHIQHPAFKLHSASSWYFSNIWNYIKYTLTFFSCTLIVFYFPFSFYNHRARTSRKTYLPQVHLQNGQCSRQDKTQNISLESVTKSMDIGPLLVKATHNPDQPFLQGYTRLTRHGLHFLLWMALVYSNKTALLLTHTVLM